jgi:hypothetical protein
MQYLTSTFVTSTLSARIDVLVCADTLPRAVFTALTGLLLRLRRSRCAMN